MVLEQSRTARSERGLHAVPIIERYRPPRIEYDLMTDELYDRVILGVAPRSFAC